MVAAEIAGAGTPGAVIVGGGPAGDAVAAGLRDGGFKGSVTLIGSEPEAPYERPHLSKGYLLGTVSRAKLPLRPAAQYRDLGVDLRLGQRVVDLGVERHSVELEGGSTIDWDVLCIATGSLPRRLSDFRNPLYLRELRDADHLRSVLSRSTSVDIVGAGFIGCEVAAVARQRGLAVRVFETLEQPMQRVLGAEAGGFLAGVHQRNGVDLRLGVEAAPNLEPLVLVAVGSVPGTALAEEAGVHVEGGIVVDELGRTSVEGVYAAGDATRFYHPLYAQRIRVEHFQTSQRQGFSVGRAMAGVAQPYIEVPWFWSDQYDLNLQYAGAGLPWDEIVTRGEFGEPPFTVFYLGGGQLIAAAGFNDHHTIARIRRLMEMGSPVSPQRLADPNFDLRRALP